MTIPRFYLLLGAALAVLFLLVPTSAPQPGDHEHMGCGSVVDPVRRDVSGMEPVYRKPTVELCARARSARVMWAVMAAGAGGTIAAVFMYWRHRRSGGAAGGEVGRADTGSALPDTP